MLHGKRFNFASEPIHGTRSRCACSRHSSVWQPSKPLSRLIFYIPCLNVALSPLCSGCGCYAPPAPTPTAAAHAAPAAAPPATPSTEAVSATAATAAAATAAPSPTTARTKASATSQQPPAAKAAGAAKRHAYHHRARGPKVTDHPQHGLRYFQSFLLGEAMYSVVSVGERCVGWGKGGCPVGLLGVGSCSCRRCIQITSHIRCFPTSLCCECGSSELTHLCQLVPAAHASSWCFVFGMHCAPFHRATNGPSTRQQPAQAGERSTPTSGTSAPPAGAQQRGVSSSPHVAQAAGQAAQQNQRKAPAPQRQPPRSQQHQHPSQVCILLISDRGHVRSRCW